MAAHTSIRILERDSNRRGDLFGRLMADLFVALGYDQPRVNIHKPGRELDLSADHRLEPRRALGECKATKEPIGGADLNKFAGVMDIEGDDMRPLTGYFISLAGFTETALEQEKQRRKTQIITLDSSQVVEELVKGRILVAKERATDIAGRCCAGLPDIVLDSELELLAHERGWIWAVYYMVGNARSHFALIHADGTPLARKLADEVVIADQDCSGTIGNLVCLNPEPPLDSDTDPKIAESKAAYHQYLSNECGFIHLDGLPADNEAGSRRLRLENLFVPLHLDVELKADGEHKMAERLPVGRALSEHSRLALLSAPGGGKSTLLKRLAVAYADPTRRSQIDDDLPSREWLPLFFRCRELRELTRASFAELLDALSKREPVRQYAAAFCAYVDRSLLAGRVLLLVDGLDEISDPGDRAAFVCTLRTVLQAYPNIAAVITSREAGFRQVAAHLAPVCTHAVLSPFDPGDIRRLTVAWHREVVGDTEKVRSDAEALAATIVSNDRIKRLAVNPLLLTTLLLVKRWVGSLPTRRAVLYGKAVEVLLMTWNTEGHEPIPEEEARPQLCYVAAAMMLIKVERISRPRLSALLREARESLPSELGYVQGTVEEFINRVEDRSSLLMMAGNAVEDGQLVEFFEFRHLTFQEFLAAQALVKGWHPDRQANDTLARVLRPHLEDEKWREVIPLAALLGGKETDELIQLLTNKVGSLNPQELGEYRIRSEAEASGTHPYILALGNCLADEAPARPETIRSAMRALAVVGHSWDGATFAAALVRSRYTADFREQAGKVLLSGDSDLMNSTEALLQYVWWRAIEPENAIRYVDAASSFVEMLKSFDRVTRCGGARALTRLCFRVYPDQRRIDLAESADTLRQGVPMLQKMLFTEDVAEQYCASLAFVWMGSCRLCQPSDEPDMLSRFFDLWQHSPNAEVQARARWALESMPLATREGRHFGASISRSEFTEVFEGLRGATEQQVPVGMAATLIIAWYLRALTDPELAECARRLMRRDGATFVFRARGRGLYDLAERLGIRLKPPK